MTPPPTGPDEPDEADGQDEHDEPAGPGPDEPMGPPRADVDVDAMGRWMLRGTVAAFVLALVGALAPGRLGTAGAVGCLAVLIGAPVVRVLWLTVGWAHHGDRRYAALGAVLLAVLGLSALAGLL